jgi:hypothetical protein
MHAAFDLNIPNYASAIVTTDAVVEAICSLNVVTGVGTKLVSHVA